MSPDTASVTLRFFSLLALYQAAGAVFFLAMFAPRLTASRSAIRRLCLYSASAGALLAVAHQTTEAARMIDAWSGVFDLELLKLAWMSPAGAAHLVQALGLVLVVVALMRPAAATRWLGVAGAMLAATALTLTGHTSVHALRPWLALLLAFHLTVVAFWLGALLPLHRVCALESTAVAAGISASFSRYAILAVPLLAVAGAMMFVMLAPSLAVLAKPYGLLVAAKFALFAFVLLPLAAYNKRRATPAMVAGDNRGARQMRRTVVAEYVIIAVVIAITILLTGSYSPE